MEILILLLGLVLGAGGLFFTRKNIDNKHQSKLKEENEKINKELIDVNELIQQIDAGIKKTKDELKNRNNKNKYMTLKERADSMRKKLND